MQFSGFDELEFVLGVRTSDRLLHTHNALVSAAVPKVLLRESL